MNGPRALSSLFRGLGGTMGGLFLALVFAQPASAIPLGLESGPHFFRTYPPALSAFIHLTNAAIDYGNQTFFGDVPAIPLISGGVGVRMAETLGEPFAFGLGFSLFGVETGTEGTWDAQEVKVQLGLSYADLHALFMFSPIPGTIFLGAGAGLAWASLSYSVVFPSLPLSFVPASGEVLYRGRAFCAALFLRAALPVFPNLSVGVEAGFRWTFFPVLLSGEGQLMDLNRDGAPDPLDLSGFWLGMSLRVELPL